MNREELLQSIEEETVFTYARSGGKGGQNVNKVNTKAHGSLDIKKIRGLTGEELALVFQKLSSRINSRGNLCIDSDSERFQEINKKIAISRLFSLIAAAAKVKAKRKKTRATRASKEKRLKIKKIRSSVKKLRQEKIEY